MNWRITIPFKCRKEFATGDDGDEWFHGVKMIEYSNGEMWCHVELIAHKNEGYNRFAPEMYDIKMCYEETEKEFHSKNKTENNVPGDISFENSSLEENKMHGTQDVSDTENRYHVDNASAGVSFQTFHTVTLDASKKVKLKPSSAIQDVVLLLCLYQT